MEYVRLETALLRDVDDSYLYSVSCRSCLHTSRLRLSMLRAYLGDDFPLAKVRERLKCETCGKREVTILFLGPHQRTGELARLFDKEARR